MKIRTLVGLAALGATASAFAVTRITPRPAVWIIRRLFDEGTRSTAEQMRRHPPTVPLERREGLRFGRMREHTRYDLVRPADSPQALPLVVWIHGGAWISGGRGDVMPYLDLLAAEGFACASIDYTIAPGATYPAALRQIDDGLRHLLSNAGDLRIDPTRVVLAGDSAGAQLVAQLAALTTNPNYAARMRHDPALDASQLRGVVLACGIYDLRAMARIGGLIGAGLHAALWAYSGTPRWESQVGGTMSVIDHVTPAFPPAFVSGGDADALTAQQSVPFADRLSGLGVAVTREFWDTSATPRLPHEYQFHLDRPEARATLARTVDFLHRVTGA